MSGEGIGGEVGFRGLGFVLKFLVMGWVLLDRL